MKWVLLCVLCASFFIADFAVRAADSQDDNDGKPHSVRRVEYLTERKDKPATTPEVTFSADTRARPLKQIIDYLEYNSGMNITLRSVSLGRLMVEIDLSSDPKHPKTWRDQLEAICRKYKLRIDDSHWKDKQIEVYRPETITFEYKDADVREVIDTIATAGKLNVVIDAEVQGKVTATLKDMPCEDALEVVVKSLGYIVVTEHGAIHFRKGE